MNIKRTADDSKSRNIRAIKEKIEQEKRKNGELLEKNKKLTNEKSDFDDFFNLIVSYFHFLIGFINKKNPLLQKELEKSHSFISTFKSTIGNNKKINKEEILENFKIYLKEISAFYENKKEEAVVNNEIEEVLSSFSVISAAVMMALQNVSICTLHLQSTL